MDTEVEPIRIAAALILDAAGHTLMVRKRGTEALIQPGGKIEPGEAPEAALARELREELGCGIVRAEFVGAFAAPAMHEPERRVEAMLFRVEIDSAPEAGEEIDALFWLTAAEAEARLLAPLSRTHVLPLVKAANEGIRDAA